MAVIQRGDLQARFRRALGMTGVSLVDMDRTLVPVIIVDDLTVQRSLDERHVAWGAASNALVGVTSAVQIRNPPGTGLELLIEETWASDATGAQISWLFSYAPTTTDLTTLIVGSGQGYIDSAGGTETPPTPRNTPLVLSVGQSTLVVAQQTVGFVGGAGAFPKNIYVPPGFAVQISGTSINTSMFAWGYGKLRPYKS